MLAINNFGSQYPESSVTVFVTVKQTRQLLDFQDTAGISSLI